jgi:hypothetical protein
MSTSTFGNANLPSMTAAEEVITKMRQNPANWGNTIYESLQRTDQFLRFLTKAKVFFNEGEGDTHKFTILSVTRPSEADIGSWTRVQKARPGYNPSTQTYSGEIRYGHRQINGALFRHGVKTQWFNKLDLAMTPKRKEQTEQVTTILGNYTKHIWELWSRRMFQKSVQCSVLNSAAGWGADQVGSYKTGVVPTSLATYDWLKSLLPAIRSATRGFSSVKEAAAFEMDDDKQLVFMGYEEFDALMDQYQRKMVTDYGQRNSEVRIAKLDLTATPLNQFMFVLMPEPPRYRQPAEGEAWEDCLIPPTVPKSAQGGPVEGDADEPNPDYHNPAIALYSESFLINIDAVKWLVPPSAMTGTLDGVAGHKFPASNYMGDFFPVDFACNENMKRENVFYAADYMSGMVGLFPGRARSILHLAAHGTAANYTLSNKVPTAEGYDFEYVIQTQELDFDGNLVALFNGTVPATPDDHDLFLVTQRGYRFPVTVRVSTTATAGTADNAPGSTLVLTVPAGYNSSDPYAKLIAIPTPV